MLLKILTSFFAIGLKTFAAIQNDDEDIIDDEWNKLLERHGLDVEKRRRCDEVFIGTTNTTSNAEKKKKKKKKRSAMIDWRDVPKLCGGFEKSDDDGKTNARGVCFSGENAREVSRIRGDNDDM